MTGGTDFDEVVRRLLWDGLYVTSKLQRDEVASTDDPSFEVT